MTDTAAPQTPARTSRRQQFSATTKAGLVDVAERLFTEQGYANTSLDAVVAGADVTKGALYHHFSGKQALFEAVFERVEQDAAAHIQSALPTEAEPWAKANAGLAAFLEVLKDPRYRRVVVLDAPAVLGVERFRELEERSAFANVLEIIRSVLDAGGWGLDDDMQQTFGRIFYGALTAAGTAIATSSTPQASAENAQVAISFILAGLQSLAESEHVELPDQLQPLADISRKP